MALVDFIYTGAVQVWTVPDGVTEVECWIAGGGTTFDYWPDYPNGWTYSPYILTVPAWGWYIPNLPVTPGDVLGITIGGCSQLHEGGWPDGGNAIDLPRFDIAAPGHGGGGATRVTRNGDLWLVGSGRGGAVAMRPYDYDAAPIGPLVIAPNGPETILPATEGEEPFPPGTTSIWIPGAMSTDGTGADSTMAAPGYVSDLVWHPDTEPEPPPGPRLGVTSPGAGGAGYNGGASGPIRYYVDEFVPEGWPTEIVYARCGKPGASFAPMAATAWAPEATVTYCEPGNPGYDPEYGGCPDPGYIPGHDYRSPAVTELGGSHGYLGFASPALDAVATRPWSVGHIGMS